jgi:uncharacterized membrane protein HdeD (DUF308 family)
MTSTRKALDILAGLLQIAVAAVVVMLPDIGFKIAFDSLIVLSIISGIKELAYYFTMARYMVGGKTILYRGLIMLDFGIFSLSMSDNVPQSFIVAYLMGIHAFSGVIRIMRARESRRLGSSWKLSMSMGVANILIAVFAVVAGYAMHSHTAVADVYAAGLIYAGLGRIINSFRKTAVAFIQL